MSTECVKDFIIVMKFVLLKKYIRWPRTNIMMKRIVEEFGPLHAIPFIIGNGSHIPTIASKCHEV